MSKIVKIILIVLLLAGIGLGGYFAYNWYVNREVTPTTDETVNQPIDLGNGEALDNATWQDLAGEDKVIDSGSFNNGTGAGNLTDSEKVVADKAVLQQTARYFVEIFGSYSSDNDFQNLKDLQPLMTSTYWAKWEKDLNTITSDKDYSVWSQAMNASIDSYSATAGTVTVLCKRGERQSKSEKENIFYQSAQVNLVKVNGSWLVDKVTWVQ
ncbi:MAG TPA: hypothetical protein PLB38_03660 [bacterium]|nr:hypothetical protein [bacterium]